VMAIVGEKFQMGEYFLPQIVIAANAMQHAMGLLQPALLARHQTAEVPGVFVIGSVQSDIHEIGKSLVATMMLANGFHVHDLGVDVAPKDFGESPRNRRRSPRALGSSHDDNDGPARRAGSPAGGRDPRLHEGDGGGRR
jgi:methanogenic corrinoid protein MtbC1